MSNIMIRFADRQAQSAAVRRGRSGDLRAKRMAALREAVDRDGITEAVIAKITNAYVHDRQEGRFSGSLADYREAYGFPRDMRVPEISESMPSDGWPGEGTVKAVIRECGDEAGMILYGLLVVAGTVPMGSHDSNARHHRPAWVEAA